MSSSPTVKVEMNRTRCIVAASVQCAVACSAAVAFVVVLGANVGTIVLFSGYLLVILVPTFVIVGGWLIGYVFAYDVCDGALRRRVFGYTRRMKVSEVVRLKHRIVFHIAATNNWCPQFFLPPKWLLSETSKAELKEYATRNLLQSHPLFLYWCGPQFRGPNKGTEQR